MSTKKLGVMMFKTMAATLRKGLYVIAAIGLPALAAAQKAPRMSLDRSRPICRPEPTSPTATRNCHRNQPTIYPVAAMWRKSSSSKVLQRAMPRPHWPTASFSPPAILTRAG